MIVKFVVPISREGRAISPEMSVDGVLAVVIAESVEDARAKLDAFCDANCQPRWSAAADVVILTEGMSGVFAYAG